MVGVGERTDGGRRAEDRGQRKGEEGGEEDREEEEGDSTSERGGW